MKHKTLLAIPVSLLTAAYFLGAQSHQPDFKGVVSQQFGELRLAVPDLRGSGDAQKLMRAFNDTLWNDIDAAGVVKLIGKDSYPLNVPQRPEDFNPPSNIRLTDWSGGGVDANDLAFGYTAVQDGKLVLLGYLYNVKQPTPQTAQLFGKRYIGSLDEAGARDVAHQFAADILAQFGGQDLSGTKIYFISDRSGPRKLPDGSRVNVKEVWAMDYDGSNQHQLTFYQGLAQSVSVSLDGKMFAFGILPQPLKNGHLADATPQIMIHSADTDRNLNFYNPKSSIVTTPSFTPDGKYVLFGTKIGNDKDENIYIANLQGGGLNHISRVPFIEEEPKVNPKNPDQIVFISGRTGHPQLWKMNRDGGGAEMLTTGEGDVANPSWSPDGQKVAFAWTRGYEYGQWNIFWMDMVSRQYVQLTHDTGRNENPSWAPDGKHIVFSSRKSKTYQIYTMLADGTHVQQLTTKGNNMQPVWAIGLH